MGKSKKGRYSEAELQAMSPATAEKYRSLYEAQDQLAAREESLNARKKKEDEQAKAKAKKESREAAEKARKDDNHEKYILGGGVLAHSKLFPAFRETLESVLNNAVKTDEHRIFLISRGWNISPPAPKPEKEKKPAKAKPEETAQEQVLEKPKDEKEGD